MRDAGRLNRRHWVVTGVAGMASLVDSAAIVSVGTGLPLWRTEHQLSDWTVGLISASMTVSIAAGAMVGGRLADGLGRERVFSATILLYAVGALVVAWAPGAGSLLLGVTVLGLAAGADLPASITMVADHAPEGTLGRLVAFTHVMWTMGVVLATAVGFAVSPRGSAGVSGIFVGLAVAAVLAAVCRLSCPPPGEPGWTRRADHMDRAAEPVLVVLRRGGHLRSAVLIAAFYVCFTLVANTFGQFRTYLLVVAGGADQALATAVSFGASLVGLLGVIGFAVIADTAWRGRVYPLGVALLVASQALLALTGAESFPAMLTALALYSIGFPFAGEALYKVWTQQSFPAEVRATVQGTTFAVARVFAAAFALVTPVLVAGVPTLLFSLLTAFVLSSGVLGLLISRSARP